MIPDKIYVGVGTLSSIQPAEEYAFPGWQEKAYSQIRNEQYIRKGALLEWAKECFRLQDSGSWYSKGAADAFSKLIDKLNEM